MKFPDKLVFVRRIVLSTLFTGSLLQTEAQVKPEPKGDAIVIATPSEADKTWEALGKQQTELNRGRRVDLGSGRGGDSAGKTNPDRGPLLDLADGAKGFYTHNPEHDKAGEARQLEVFTLIQLKMEGDETVEGRLDAAVREATGMSSLPEATRAKIAAAQAFTQGRKDLSGGEADRAVIKQTARQLIKKYPTQPQGYQALWAIARSGGTVEEGLLAKEIVESSAPVEYRRKAQSLLDRAALVGRPLPDVLGVAGEELLATIPAGKPIIVYSWAEWGPGSIELGRMIQARRFEAIGICLDTDIEAAKEAQHAANLGGQHVYSEKGPEGEVAALLKCNTAGQIYLVDQKGIIRDVRGGDDLERKLRELDFKTPELKAPELSL